LAVFPDAEPERVPKKIYVYMFPRVALRTDVDNHYTQFMTSYFNVEECAMHVARQFALYLNVAVNCNSVIALEILGHVS
jgi:hypothetical protein